MRCEVCGRKIFGKPHRVIIEGAKMTVCGKCAKLGSGTWEEKRKSVFPKPAIRPFKQAIPTKPVQAKQSSQQDLEPPLDLVEDFAVKIRKAREKLGLSHEELGRRLSEKVSVLKKIESGKMTPDMKLVVKLEHALKIKLLAPLTEPKPLPAYQKTPMEELTLGDLVNLNEGEGEDSKKREQS